MNKETIELLNQLATKLGTTVEHLWEVLIRQAFISGMIDILQYLIITIIIIFYIKYIKNKELYDDFSGFITIIVGCVLAIIVLAAFFCVHDTITSFVNPEYWALEKILEKI